MYCFNRTWLPIPHVRAICVNVHVLFTYNRKGGRVVLVGLLKVNWFCKINIDRRSTQGQYSSWSSKPFTLQLYSHWIPRKVPEYNPNRDANVATPFSQLLSRPKFVYRGQVPGRVCGQHLGSIQFTCRCASVTLL